VSEWQVAPSSADQLPDDLLGNFFFLLLLLAHAFGRSIRSRWLGRIALFDPVAPLVTSNCHEKCRIYPSRNFTEAASVMITLYHTPRSRSSRIIWLLEELGVDYQIEITPIKRRDGTGSSAPDSYAAIHPMKKVPAVKIFNEVIFESGAICLYLTNTYTKKDIGPVRGDNNRAEYVRWLFFYAGVIEPVAAARMMGWDKNGPTGMGTFEDVEAVISRQLAATPYILGDSFSAADILIGTTLQFFQGSLIPDRPCYKAYLDRLTSRPAYQRALVRDNG
jgi:glutathione S-transferase